jgi:hypothetical protein
VEYFEPRILYGRGYADRIAAGGFLTAFYPRALALRLERPTPRLCVAAQQLQPEHAHQQLLPIHPGLYWRSVEVVAESVYEASVLAPSALSKHEWIESVGPGTRLDIQIIEPNVTHTLLVAQLKQCLDRPPMSPADRRVIIPGRVQREASLSAYTSVAERFRRMIGESSGVKPPVHPYPTTG